MGSKTFLCVLKPFVGWFVFFVFGVFWNSCFFLFQVFFEKIKWKTMVLRWFWVVLRWFSMVCLVVLGGSGWFEVSFGWFFRRF